MAYKGAYECETHYFVTVNEKERADYIKGRLRRYALLGGEINVLTQRLRGVKVQEEEYAADCTRSIGYVPHGMGGHSDPAFNAVNKMIENYQNKAAVLQRRIREMVDERVQIDELMECLAPREREIIRQRYIRRVSWVAIAHDQFLCERQCQRYSERGIKKMARRLCEILPPMPEADTDPAGNDIQEDA